MPTDPVVEARIRNVREELNPSAENLARYFYQELRSGLADHPPAVPVHIGEVKIWETDTTTATYRE